MHWKSFGFLSFLLLPGSPSEPRSKQGAAAGEHHQRLRPRAVQESAGTCLGRPCKRESSSSPPSLTLFCFPFFFTPPLPFSLLFVFFSVSVRKPSPAATGGVCDIFGSLDNHFRVFFFFCSFLCFIYSLNNHIYGFVFLSWLTTNTFHLFLP